MWLGGNPGASPVKRFARLTVRLSFGNLFDSWMPKECGLASDLAKSPGKLPETRKYLSTNLGYMPK